ncbi:plexin-C1-like protein [Lates japonicus]|uniref:Plexin-C1-like protein n=1 Tax=Lates japonicus TaxID=270547 RepID=A0AAD3N1D7_LATJO|nr:plexin-C1-like protein [Lates japonicus]
MGNDLASSVIPGGPRALERSVQCDGGQQHRAAGALTSALISPRDDSRSRLAVSVPKRHATLKPKAVLFKQNYMTSVLAVRQKAWMVFFIGTGDGQLIKLAVDKDYHTACP